MQVKIKDIDIEFNFSIGHITDIVQYKRFYEPHDKVTLTQYLSRIDNQDYAIDNLCDLIYYAHAIRSRNVGKQPVLTYADVAEWVLMNAGAVEHVIKSYTESLPQPQGQEVAKKKTVKSQKS